MPHFSFQGVYFEKLEKLVFIMVEKDKNMTGVLGCRAEAMLDSSEFLAPAPALLESGQHRLTKEQTEIDARCRLIV